ncbi:MAG: hypothetical protein ACQKBY_08805 [Verrucomicrobiales bacterium]
MPREKTVYILGAGFSKAANLPLQGELLPAVLKQENENSNSIKNFIKTVYGLVGDAAKQLALEDVYTPIHQAISSGQYLKSYTPDKLKEVERCLNLEIANVMNDRVGHDKYAQDFVDYLQGHSLPRRDSFSIISLNWDIMLDKILFQKLKQDTDVNGNRRGLLNYCNYGTQIWKYNEVSGTNLTSSRNRNTIKLLKLHGSLNWVSCPRCNRLFINPNEKSAIAAYTRTATCKKCEGGVKLETEIALPTFQKDLSRIHFQHIWHKAAIELSEATKLVFVGYSFPLADFDFRALITKHVSTTTAVEVVLYSHDKRPTPEGQRYIDYFGNHRCSIRYDGVEAYVNSLNHSPTE